MHRSLPTIRAGRLAGIVAPIAAAVALSACIGGNDGTGPSGPRSPAPRPWVLPEVLVPERADPDYFPHRFPVPQGEIEPLPAQF